MHLICDAEARITPTPRPYALFEPAQPTVCGQVRFLNHGLQRFLSSREVIATRWSGSHAAPPSCLTALNATKTAWKCTIGGRAVISSEAQV
uniref:Uncharacterized protein n=1 Tax=Coccidioides posadasii RMSCC 3488 TaxID=454284 RepID=A0A0J6FEK6_COCPO|nr:hypothetical protein CPAG_03988 [Coccidioides posadasii RMSCC 3488]